MRSRGDTLGAKALIRVYFAGKVRKNCWRHELVPNLGGVHHGCCGEDHVEGDGLWRAVETNIKRCCTVGPFFVADDHGCYHGDGQHGWLGRWDLSENTHEVLTDAHGEEYIASVYCATGSVNDSRFRVVREKCLHAVDQADFIFAWIEEDNCHGTLCELGYAYANSKPIYLAGPAVYKLHFARSLAAVVDLETSNVVRSFERAVAWACTLPIPTVAVPVPCSPPGDSPIEKLFAAEWHKQTGTYPKAQVPIGAYRVDFLVGKLVIECDGHAFHATKEQRGRDAKRDRDLIELGYRTIRFTGTEIHKDVAACVAQSRRITKQAA